MCTSIRCFPLTLLITLCLGTVLKGSSDKLKGDVCSISELRSKFDINVVKFDVANYANIHESCVELKFIDRGTEDKFQVYEKKFTVDDLGKILKDVQYERMQLETFIDLIIYCLSEQNTLHTVSVDVKSREYMKIEIKYTPDQFTAIAFMFKVPAKEMNELDLLKLRVKEIENPQPILFYNYTIANREAGWSVIKLDYCDDANHKYIQHNTNDGSIHVYPGTYTIEAEGTSYGRNGINVHIIQIINDENTIKINGTPQNAGASTSRILKRVIDIEKETNLIFQWWWQYPRNKHEAPHYPREDVGSIYVAAVSIQKI